MTNLYHQPATKTAVKAKADALKIAMSPVIFQSSYALIKLGILQLVGDAAKSGITVKEIAQQLSLSEYGIKVLLDVGLSAELVYLKNDKYFLDKTGYFLLADSMVHVNLDFIQDVCYQGLAQLTESIKTGKAKGLKVLSDGDTIYPALSSLPEPAKSSWFKFDHYYSDKVFPIAVQIVFKHHLKSLYDIGGNTGKWAKYCLEHDEQVEVTIIDLPEQIGVIEQTFSDYAHKSRLYTYPANLLDKAQTIPADADAIWMSQFLDCFSEDEILSILQRIAKSMSQTTRLYILELFWDRQEYESAAFTINCTSIYFTCIANGNSRMYHSKDLIKLIQEAGLYVDEDIDHLGPGHTLLCCKKKR